MRSQLLLAALCAAPSVVLATVDEVPADRYIVQVQVQSLTALVEIDPPFSDFQGCTQSGSGWLQINLDSDKSLLTATLVAATAKQKVGFQLSGCSGGPLDYPLVQRVDVTF